MSAPTLIDNLAFAKRGERLEGSFPLGGCSRLIGLLDDLSKGHALSNKADITVNYLLHGKTNNVGQHFLFLTISTRLMTTCQRCLNEMSINLLLNFNYLISNSNVDEMEDSDDWDWLEPNTLMDVTALIEEEIIMAMPIAPVHDEECGVAKIQSGEKTNPFAVLKGFVQSQQS